MSGHTNCDTSAQSILLSNKKGWAIDRYSQMDKSQYSYVEWKKADIKGTTAWFYLHKSLKKWRADWWLPGDREKGPEGGITKGCEKSLGGDKYSLSWLWCSFTSIHIYHNIKFYIFNTCSLLKICEYNTSIKQFLKITIRQPMVLPVSHLSGACHRIHTTSWYTYLIEHHCAHLVKGQMDWAACPALCHLESSLQVEACT